MTAARDLRRVTLRTACVLLAAGIVVVATWAVTLPYDPREGAPEAQPAQTRAATPGSEAALRRVLDEIRRGQPDYSRMSKKLAAGVPRELSVVQRLLADLGPLQSVAYRSANPGGGDIYRVTFANGSLDAGISMGQGGTIEALAVRRPEVPRPQDYIDGYAAFPMRERTTRMATQLALLLAAAAFGRLALRIRL